MIKSVYFTYSLEDGSPKYHLIILNIFLVERTQDDNPKILNLVFLRKRNVTELSILCFLVSTCKNLYNKASISPPISYLSLPLFLNSSHTPLHLVPWLPGYPLLPLCPLHLLTSSQGWLRSLPGISLFFSLLTLNLVLLSMFSSFVVYISQQIAIK